MNTNEFKASFYLVRTYQRVSEIEFKCKIVVKDRNTDKEITGIETKINTFEIGQGIADSRFAINPISWERYLNQTIIMLFNMLLYRLSIVDIYNVDGQKAIGEFFIENPFHAE
jgi:hypothetical protein